MKTSSPRTSVVLALVLGVFSSTLFSADLYHSIGELPISGDGGWDYLSIDATAHRLYLTHGTRIVVIDTAKDVVAGEITGLSGVHGFAVAPKLGTGFASNGRENTVSTVALSTLATVRKTTTGENPDAILFEPAHSEVYAFNGRGKSATVINPETGAVVATIPLEGKPEFSQAEDGRVFVNIEDKHEVAVIDGATHRVTASWPLAPGEEPTGMEIDPEHHRLFVGCGNAKLIILDTRDGHIVANVPAGNGIDAVAFDAGKQLVYTSNGSDGTTTIVREDTPDKYTVVQTLTTERSARTLAVDPASHKIYLASAKFEARVPGSNKRPAMIPGSFKVLIYGLSP